MALTSSIKNDDDGAADDAATTATATAAATATTNANHAVDLGPLPVPVATGEGAAVDEPAATSAGSERTAVAKNEPLEEEEEGSDDAAADDSAAKDNNATNDADVSGKEALASSSEGAAASEAAAKEESPKGKNENDDITATAASEQNDDDASSSSASSTHAGNNDKDVAEDENESDNVAKAESDVEPSATAPNNGNENNANDDANAAKPPSKSPVLVHDPKPTERRDSSNNNDHVDDDDNDNDDAPNFPGCSCRKSACLLLYCPCFGEGKSCAPSCKCLNCKNPKGANANSKTTLEERKKRERKEKIRRKEARRALEEAKKRMMVVEEDGMDGAVGGGSGGGMEERKQQVIMLTVSPGRLGLTLQIVSEGGARITHVDPACTFRGQIEPGDRIVSIDGNTVNKLEDVTVGKERVRQFGIVKKNKDVEAAVAYAASVFGTIGVNNGMLAAKNIPIIAGRKNPASMSNSNSTAAAASAANNAPTTGGPRKQTFPHLNELNATADDRSSEHRREDIMTELLQWDKKHNVNTTAKMGPSRYQIICVPLKRRDTVNKRELDNQCFHQYNKQTKVFDKFLNAWASYCDGTDEDAANMLLFNLAKRFPQCYVKNFLLANKMNDKLNGVAGNGGNKVAVELPPNFVSYDGTNDIKWNTRYAELAKYKEENDDCKVYSKTDLGRWVCSQRSARVTKAKSLSPKRIQLLDDLGFLWSGLPEGWARPIPGGDPRQNRAIASKVAYPDLTIREALYMGGFSEEELNAVKDQKHTWRTGYVYLKDIIVKKVENYEVARRSGARLQIEALVNTLQSEEEDRLEKVFGEARHLLPEFLELAEERKRTGVVEKPIKSRVSSDSGGGNHKRRRHSEDAFLDPMLDHHEDPMRKQARHNGDDNVVDDDDVEGEHHHQQQHMGMPPGADSVDFQPQMNYDPNGANAQQVARDLHSWRQQSNYWR